MTKRVSVIGAGGHSIPVISLLRLNGIAVEGIYDDSFYDPDEQIAGYSVLGNMDAVSSSERLVLAVGDNHRRKIIFEKYREQIVSRNLFHPAAMKEEKVFLGKGNQIFAGAFLNSYVSVGDNNIINTRAVLEHEVHLGNHNHVSVNAVLCGRVVIGSRCFLGAGSVIKDNIKIADDVVVGANATVIRDIDLSGTYVGCPARKIA